MTIYNEYGPTEATVGCMIYQYDPKKDLAESVPIGKPIANTKIYILDKYYNLLPPNVVGDLYIEGDGLARGYLKQKELTDNSFIINKNTKKRMYRTGDKARFIDFETIVYEGREDNKKKVRGHRIEIGEIENLILTYKGMEDAYVLVKEIKDDTSMICAYFVSKDRIKEGDVREYLLKKLPTYMMPSVMMQIDSIPLTVNGKVDKSKLPLPQVPIYDEQEEVSFNEVESVFFLVVADVLETRNIRKDDNFYYLGGDSIKAIQLSARLKKEGYRLKINEILEHPVFLEMLHYVLPVLQQKEDTSLLCEGVISPTPIIQWFFNRKLTRPGRYCQRINIVFDKKVTKGDLQQIIYNLIWHHDILRMNIDTNSNQLFYNNNFEIQDVLITEWDLRDLSEEMVKETLKENNDKLLDEIEINTNKLFLHSYLYHTNTRDIWSFAIHHLVVDGVSFRILLEDIETLYTQIVNGQELSIPDKTASYQQWAKQFEGKCIIESGLKLKTTRFIGSSQNIAKKSLDLEMSRQLMTLANNSYNTQPIELMVAAMVLVMEKHLKKSMSLEIETHGRNSVGDALDITRTVGWFTNILPFHVVKSHTSLSDLIKDVKEIYRQTIKEDLPYDNKLSMNEDLVIRLNFLGDLKTEYKGFSLQTVMDNNIEMTAGIEVNLLLNEKKLQVISQAKEEVLTDAKNQEFIQNYLEAVGEIIRHCLSEEDINFTPSDFENVSLSQSELDLLFE